MPMDTFRHRQDKVLLTGVTFYGYHGSNAAERERGQRFVVDVEMETDLSLPGATDNLANTINYSAVCKAIGAIMEGDSRNLIERVSQELAEKLLHDFPASAVRIRITKPHPPIQGATVGTAAVEIYRQRQA